MFGLIDEQSKYLYRDKNGKEHWRATLWADDIADLADIGERLVAEPSSMCFIVHAGVIAMLDSAGKWCDISDGSEVTA